MKQHQANYVRQGILYNLEKKNSSNEKTSLNLYDTCLWHIKLWLLHVKGVKDIERQNRHRGRIDRKFEWKTDRIEGEEREDRKKIKGKTDSHSGKIETKSEVGKSEEREDGQS
jgi:hypothetical protein